MKVKFLSEDNIICKLEFLNKYSKNVTVSQTSLTTKNLQIIFSSPITTSKDFTINIKDLISILKATNEFEIKNKKINLKYTKYVETNDFIVEIERSFKISDEDFKLPSSNVLMSVKISKLLILSSSNFTIQCNNDGQFIMTSNDILETKFESKVEVLDCNTDKVEICIRGNDLKILELFDQDKIFYFFKNFILVYVLEDLCSTIILLNVLVNR